MALVLNSTAFFKFGTSSTDVSGKLFGGMGGGGQGGGVVGYVV